MRNPGMASPPSGGLEARLSPDHATAKSGRSFRATEPSAPCTRRLVNVPAMGFVPVNRATPGSGGIVRPSRRAIARLLDHVVVLAFISYAVIGAPNLPLPCPIIL